MLLNFNYVLINEYPNVCINGIFLIISFGWKATNQHAFLINSQDPKVNALELEASCLNCHVRHVKFNAYSIFKNRAFSF